jgi:hypothetical protein
MAEKRCVYKCGAWNCGSYQFNLYKDAVDQGELCDVHYWQTKAQNPWQGLTPEEVLDLFDRNNVYGSKWVEFARTVEAKLKERNT